MRKSLGLVAAVSLALPAQAHEWADQTTGRHTGAFVGAQFKMAFHGRKVEAPRASLGIAPAFSRVSTHGVHTNIGDGLALSITRGAKPNLTLGGVRADTALGLTRDGHAAANGKLGVSTGGWIAIGVGTVLVAGAVGFALWADHVIDCEEREHC
jgi:hypothetical protein